MCAISSASISGGAALLELKSRLHAGAEVAPRRGLEVAEVGLVDDDRADVVAVADVVDARELAEAPAAAPLLESGCEVPDGERIGEVRIRVVHRNARAVQRLEARVVRRAAVSELTIELVLSDAGK